MKNTYLVLALLFLSVTAISSCKKKGCTDPLAINYFSDVKSDDGSCSYSTTRMGGDYSYIYDDQDAQAFVYSRGISVLRVDGIFDESITNFDFIVDWANRTMAMPDTLLPPSTTCNGVITDKDNFACTLKVDPAGTDNDTIYYYDFKRL
ncbi:MAG: hypothetical protein KJ941_09175 [Bacteroidetes bacterium]|nr:hypothetical protein [Bacteroidota bacterium]